MCCGKTEAEHLGGPLNKHTELRGVNLVYLWDHSQKTPSQAEVYCSVKEWAYCHFLGDFVGLRHSALVSICPMKCRGYQRLSDVPLENISHQNCRKQPWLVLS